MQRVKNKHLKMTALLTAMLLVVCAITNGSVSVNATEALPDGAYNPDTYEPHDYVIKHCIADDPSTGGDYFNNLVENTIFCCGDTITCNDVNPSNPTNDGESNYCIVSDSDHSLQALIDMGIVDVEYSDYNLGENDTRKTIKKIIFKDNTKLVRLYLHDNGYGSTTIDGKDVVGSFNGVSVKSILSTSLKIDNKYTKDTGFVETSGEFKEDELLWYGNKDKIATTLYPIIEKGKSYDIENPLPVVKGFFPYYYYSNLEGYTLSAEGISISSDMRTAVMTVPTWLDDYAMNYDEEYSDYYDNNELKVQSNGKYKYPVIDKVLLSIGYTSRNNIDCGRFTLTFHGNEGTVDDGYNEYTLYVPDSLYESGEVDTVLNNGETNKDFYNLTYDKLASLVETPKRDGYEFVRWCQKDNGEQDNYYLFHGLNRTELQKGYWQSDYYSANISGGFNVDLYAVWNHIDHKWNEGEVTKTATATEDGIKTYTCTICNATKTEVIPKTGTAAETAEAPTATPATATAVATTAAPATTAPAAAATTSASTTPDNGAKKSIKFKKKKVTIKKGKKATLKVTIKGAKKAKFSVNKKKVAKIVKKKAKAVTVKGVKKGKAVVKAKAAGKTAKCKVTVK